jgi:hypothetical protein
MTPAEVALSDRELLAEMRALELVATWQRARRDHDYSAAARAERELERLGVVLRAIRPAPGGVAREEARP